MLQKLLAKYLCCFCLFFPHLFPALTHADGSELLEAMIASEALVDNAANALPNEPQDNVSAARKALQKALRRITKAVQACPQNERKSKRNLLASARQLAQFHQQNAAIADDTSITLNQQAETAIRALQDLASSRQICDDGRVLKAGVAVFIQIAPFASMAEAWGERNVGAHGTFGIFPGNAASPPHIHTHGYYGVVIEGEIANPFGTESDPLVLPAGSFWYVPAGEQHITECVSDDPCLFYFHSDQKFDFTPIAELTDERSADALSIPASELVFEPISSFASFSTVWGDRANGAHGTFGIFMPGAESPPHTHSMAYHGVVLSGTLVNPFNDETNPPRIRPGGYWSVPARVEHVTACISDEPCVFYFHAQGAFDFLTSHSH